MLRITALTGFWLLVAGAASGAEIYRCGNTYAQTPCPDGRVLDATAPQPDPQEVRARSEATRREARLADALARERQAREQQAARVGAASLSPGRVTPKVGTPATEPAPTHRRKAHRHKPRQGDDFVAVTPRAPKQRAAD